MRDYPRGFRNGFFRPCRSAVSDSLAIAPALPVASLFSCCRRSVVLLAFPSRPSPRRFPAFVAAIALSRPLRMKTPLASLQQTAPLPRASAWRLAGLPCFGRECRILVRAHGSVSPRSSCPGRDVTPLRGAFGSGSAQTQESIAEHNLSPPPGASGFSRLACAVGPHDRLSRAPLRAQLAAINQWRSGPFWHCHNGPFARCH
jgi:hypothetical protein